MMVGLGDQVTAVKLWHEEGRNRWRVTKVLYIVPSPAGGCAECIEVVTGVFCKVSRIPGVAFPNENITIDAHPIPPTQNAGKNGQPHSRPHSHLQAYPCKGGVDFRTCPRGACGAYRWVARMEGTVGRRPDTVGNFEKKNVSEGPKLCFCKGAFYTRMEFGSSRQRSRGWADPNLRWHATYRRGDLGGELLHP